MIKIIAGKVNEGKTTEMVRELKRYKGGKCLVFTTDESIMENREKYGLDSDDFEVMTTIEIYDILNIERNIIASLEGVSSIDFDVIAFDTPQVPLDNIVQIAYERGFENIVVTQGLNIGLGNTGVVM